MDDLELSQRVCESLLLADTRLRPEGEEAVLGACGRLRHTVDTLLELLNQANTQVTHRRPTLTARPIQEEKAVSSAPRQGLQVSPWEGQAASRSEERRVGKECLRLCRSRWSPYH